MSWNVTDLRCEYEVNPIGMDVARPRLFWKVESARRGARQTAYRVVVSMTDGPTTADLWDSGRVESDQTTFVTYGGPALGSGQRAFWKVTSWDEQGATTTSAGAYWEAGLLNSEAWAVAQWIQPVSRAGQLSSPGYARTDFSVGSRVASARLFATALGVYVASINGRSVSSDLFRPGWTDYDKRVQYQTYDVSELIKEGANAIGFVVGDGWYAGEIGWVQGSSRGRGYWGTQPAVRAQLHLTFEDGTTKVVVTDGSWRSSTGPVVTSDFLHGEVYDARSESPGWDSPGFDTKLWRGAVVTRPKHGAIVAQTGPSVRQRQTVTPVSIRSVGGATHVIDFGQNMVGYVRLKVRGARGTTVILRHAEVLNADGTLYVDNLRRARQTDQYTLRGDPNGETWEPTFTFHGFRYVEVGGYPGELTPDALTGVVIHTDCPWSMKFECSNALVNQLQSNIRWGQRGNWLEVPTDCPQRDERLGWMGDIQVFGRTAMFNMNTASFLTKWITDVRDAQTEEGAYADVCPRVPALLPADAAPAWGDAGIIVPWTFYRTYGDTGLLKEHYDSMKAWVAHVQRHNPDGIWRNRRGNNYGEWLSIKADTPKDVLSTAFFFYSTSLLARIAGVMKRVDDEAYYTELADRIRVAFQRTYVKPDGRIVGETQACYVIALQFGLVPDALRPSAAQHLVDDIRSRDWHLSTGFIGVSYLLPVLTEAGHADVAYKLLLKETFPSWGYSIRNGATTIWERWDGWTHDKGFQDTGMNSFNHYCFGSVGEWMYRYVAGIDWEDSAAGTKRLILKPVIGGGLTHASGAFESIHGEVVSAWKVDAGRLKWNVKVPPNTTAKAYVPTSSASSVREGGRELSSVEGVRQVESDGSVVVLELESGSYTFEANA